MRGVRRCRSCRSCSQQHTKCVVQSGSLACTRCLDAGRECDFDPKFRFKQVVRIESSQATRPAIDLVYDKDQTWVDTERYPLNYVFEDGIHLDQDAGATVQEQSIYDQPSRSPVAGISQDTPPAVSERIGLLPFPVDFSHEVHDLQFDPASEDRIVPSQVVAHLNHTRSASNTGSDTVTPLNLPSLHPRNNARGTSVGISPGSTFSQAISPPGDYTVLSSTYVARPSIQEENPVIRLSRREAGLVQYYITKMAPWADTCDPERHFARDVPHRALRKPMMLYAIFALCTRHQAIVQGKDEIESTTYQDRCLGLLIDALSAPEDTYDEDLLATVIILRHYEELKTHEDNQYHLFGSSQLLNAISRFSSSGGLGEAASWWCLRQAIYASLVSHQPLEIRLENYDHSAAFGLRTESSATNVVVLIFAKMLTLLYSSDVSDVTAASQWTVLEQDLEKWNLLKPSSYRPIFYQEPDFRQNRPFPVICMTTPPQVVGLQYYHAAKIALLQHAAHNQPRIGFRATKDRRNSEREVSVHLSAIVGLAVSNEFVSNACFEAHHLLLTSGYCFQHPLQREHAIHFLERAERTTGWTMSQTVALLKEQWRDLDAPG